ncbi:MAG: glycosyltransferase family 4 protein [Candidatus Diapherotrites archaeon]
MKALHLSHHFWPCIGGVEKVIENICINAEKHGIESTILCLNKCPKGKEKLKKEEKFEKLKKIKIQRIPFIDLKYYKIAPHALFYPKKEFDLIHVHGLGFFSDLMLLTKFLHRKPVIVSTYGSIFHTKKFLLLKKIYFNLIQRALLSFADKVIVISKADETKAKEIISTPDYAPIGAELKKMKKEEIEKMKKQKNSFVFVGRYSKNKRIELLIEKFTGIIKEKKDAKLFIIGKDFDELKKEFEKKISEAHAQKNIFLTENLSDKEIEQKYAKCEFFVSASEYESFGISAVEAMNYGLIPILNDIPAFREFIEGEKKESKKNKEKLNGFIVDFESKNAEKKIIEIMDLNENEKKMISLNAHKKAQEYSWNEKIKKYIEIYEETGKESE